MKQSNLTDLDLYLIEAVKNNASKKEIENLISKGADVDAKSRLGISPLFWATLNENEELIELLISEEADVNSKNDFGKTPIFLSVENDNINITRLLILNGADIEVKDEGSRGLFYYVKSDKMKDILKNTKSIKEKINYKTEYKKLKKENEELKIKIAQIQKTN